MCFEDILCLFTRKGVAKTFNEKYQEIHVTSLPLQPAGKVVIELSCSLNYTLWNQSKPGKAKKIFKYLHSAHSCYAIPARSRVLFILSPAKPNASNAALIVECCPKTNQNAFPTQKTPCHKTVRLIRGIRGISIARFQSKKSMLIAAQPKPMQKRKSMSNSGF
jgi:hypothetical protein